MEYLSGRIKENVYVDAEVRAALMDQLLGAHGDSNINTYSYDQSIRQVIQAASQPGGSYHVGQSSMDYVVELQR